MKWRKVVLSDDDIANRKDVELKAGFRNLYHNQGCPRDAGMYQLRAAPTEYWFSPGAWTIAWTLLEEYGATECGAPKESEVIPEVTHSVLPEVPFAAKAG